MRSNAIVISRMSREEINAMNEIKIGRFIAELRKEKKLTQNLSAVSFSTVLLLGIIVCSICDIAISGTFSWSLYPITAIVFGWSVFMPFVKYGSRGTLGSLVIFSILIIPFLYVMSMIVGDHLIMQIGVRMSLYSIAYLWCVYLIFRKSKWRK